ncbi:alpha-(1-2)-phosphatidylinositol mannoside mannosyltransferase [Phycisphaerae bacterium RAS1]|nr:alpha-(1-2)-phosphatidylinositol mannoside mannosyltransferase [Phycisphaerae bacterium RAS1]
MILRREERRSPWRGWRPLLIGAAVYAVGLAGYAALRAESSTDFRDFWQTARHFRETGQITDELGVHNYLPFFVIFMMPWSFLPLQAAITLFTLASLGLFVATILLSETLLSGGLPPRPRAATWLAVVLAFPYVHSCGVLGAMGLLLLFLTVSTWFLVERRQEWAAGVPLGLAIIIKLLPGVLLIFFLLRQRWRVAATAVATAVVLGGGLPAASLGFERAAQAHREFYERAVVGHSAKTTITAEKPRKAKYSNNALPIVLRRLLSPTDGDPKEGRSPLLVNIADLPLDAIWWVFVAVSGAMLLAGGAATVRDGLRSPPGGAVELERERLQFGLWCAAMLLFSPLVWTHYLPLLYWPLAVLADRLERVRRARRRFCRIALAALVGWGCCAILLAWPAARAAGAQLLGVFLVWAACVWLSAAPQRTVGADPHS